MYSRRASARVLAMCANIVSVGLWSVRARARAIVCGFSRKCSGGYEHAPLAYTRECKEVQKVLFFMRTCGLRNPYRCRAPAPSADAKSS
eukprot:3060246-Pleurochrysis_carterae.AAC.1